MLHFYCGSTRYLRNDKNARNINDKKKTEKLKIDSNTQAVVRTLQKVIHTNSLLGSIKDELKQAFHKGVDIKLRWVPSHKGTQGNEIADKFTKYTCDSKIITFIPMLKRDVKKEY